MEKESILSNSRLKKVNKKLLRLQHIILKDTGINCSLEPKKNLVICNTGLANGLTEEVLYEHFSKCGPLENIFLLPGKSFCFIAYKDQTTSLTAFNTYNGKLNIAQNNKPVYLLFTDALPLTIEPLKHFDKLPSGLVVIENFITENEEEILTKLFNIEESKSSEMKHRQVQHFGFEFRYDINNVDKDKPLEEKIPEECTFLFKKLANTIFKSFKPDQLTVNHYKPGQGIPDHVDTHSAFEDPIMSLSLQSSVVMEFKRQDKHYCVVLPQRSLAIMSGESRYDWTHGITPRKFDVIKTATGFTTSQRKTRISLTFRKVLQGECQCMYKRLCDSYKESKKEIIEENAATKLEKLHVQNVYENIAEHFSDTRHKPWPIVTEFIQSFNVGNILVDVGSGNGKYLTNDGSIFKIGCDTSVKLAEICRQRNYEIFCANCLNLPFKDNIADGVISIAVIHHLSTEERRLLAIKNIIRILKPHGQALIYVWAKDQHKNQEKSSYIKQDRKHRKSEKIVEIGDNNMEKVNVTDNISLTLHVNRTQFKDKDMLVPWKKKGGEGVTFLRYYHVFDENELENLCLHFPEVEIVKSYYDQGNWCVVLKKKNKAK